MLKWQKVVKPAALVAVLLISLLLYSIIYKANEFHFDTPEGNQVEEGGSETDCTLTPDEAATRYKIKLAKAIDAVYSEISLLAGKESIIQSQWAERFEALVAELDPRMKKTDLSKAWDYSARLPDMGPASPFPNGKRRHVCPEVYFGNRYGFPFQQHGMEMENCHYVPKFSSVLTAIIPAKPSDNISFVLTNIRKFYDIPIIVLVLEGTSVDVRVQNVQILRHSNLTEAQAMNEALEQVRTPYVFIGLGLAHFSNQSSLERMVRVMDELSHVQVVGGAVRDRNGRWIHGCLQKRMVDYQATYTLGYYYSKYECMYCDDLLTPFTTRTELLLSVPYTNELSGPSMYRDWFAKVSQAGHLTMTCPDVMFFIGDHVQMNSDEWLELATHWDLEKIHSYTGEVHNFSCASVGIACEGYMDGGGGSLLLPPCCRAIVERELGFLMDYAEKNNIRYEIRSGLALGALKMEGYLPWNSSIEFAYQRSDLQKWLSMRGKYLNDKKCRMEISDGDNTHFTVSCRHILVNFNTFGNLSSRLYLPREYRNTTTKILFGHRWRETSANPGLSIKNEVGREFLKHSPVGKTLEEDREGEMEGPKYLREVPTCTQPHHSCLDLYPLDGNLPFSRPFLHP